MTATTASRTVEEIVHAAAGADAWKRGEPRLVPRDLLAGDDPRVGEGDGIANAGAWYRGWDRANMAAPAGLHLEWDEPARASTPRGWLRNDGTCVGFYLDYGPDNYRSPHSYDRGDMIVTFCTADRPCREHQPGNILVVAYPRGPGTSPHTSRWVVTVDEAKSWIEKGGDA